jgi:hypothetical protein
MPARQENADANNDTHKKTNHETKARGVTHRTLAEVENSRRFIFMHGQTFVLGSESASERNGRRLSARMLD